MELLCGLPINSDDKIYAYVLATKARDSAKDFDTLLAAGNQSPRGLWSQMELPCGFPMLKTIKSTLTTWRPKQETLPRTSILYRQVPLQ